MNDCYSIQQCTFKPLTLLHNISGTFIFICLFYDKFQCHESEHTQVLDVADVITNTKKDRQI